MTEHDRAFHDYRGEVIDEIASDYPEKASAAEVVNGVVRDLEARLSPLVEIDVVPLPALAECTACRWHYGARVFTCAGHVDWLRDRKRDHLEAP